MSDILFTLGFVSLSAGLYFWNPTMTLIIDGVILMTMGLLSAMMSSANKTGG